MSESIVRSADTVMVTGEHWERMLAENARLLRASDIALRLIMDERDACRAENEHLAAEVERLTAHERELEMLALSGSLCPHGTCKFCDQIWARPSITGVGVDACKAELHDLAEALEEFAFLYDQVCAVAKERTPAWEMVQDMVRRTDMEGDCCETRRCPVYAACLPCQNDAWLDKGKEGAKP